tara:strand:+ start:21200 stop:21490 length:291 start_codon:yes stop_codon:yes gene_type:complete
MSDKDGMERRSSDVKLAILQTEQTYIKKSVTDIQGELKTMQANQKEEHGALIVKLDKIDHYLTKQKGMISTIVAFSVGIWSVILLSLQHFWDRIFP